MKLVLLTNMPSSHQIPLGRELARLLGSENVRLVFEQPTSQARQEMGWADAFEASYILRAWESEQARREIAHWIESADVVIQGRYPLRAVRARIKRGQLTFAYQERFWKRPFHWPRVLARLPRIYRRYWSVMKPNYHLLAAGAYVAPDLAKLACFKHRMWKFGYFLKTSDQPPVKAKPQRLELLWCARFSAVKRPADALAIVQGLLTHGVDCRLTMIGDGDLRQSTEHDVAADQQLAAAVRFMGWQSEEKVAEQMHRADCLLMTSGFGEGWAMVVNEALNAGCMVVANRFVGAAPWLIQHGHTGLLYQQNQIADVVREVAALSVDQIRAMGERGFVHHQTIWSAGVAAQRVVELSTLLLDNKLEQASKRFTTGPCSAAESH